MQEIGLELLKHFGLNESSGRRVEDETGEGDIVTVFDVPDRTFKQRICVDDKTSKQYRVRWFQEFPKVRTLP